MNWSAEGGIWSSLQYRGEGVTHSPTAPRCLRTARYGRTMRDLRRTGGVSGGTRVSGPISESETASNAPASSRTASQYLKHSQKLCDRGIGDRSGSEKGADEGSWKEKGNQMSKG